MNVSTDQVRVHILDDHNGFVETPHEVRRVRGDGLTGLSTCDSATVARLLEAHGLSTAPAPAGGPAQLPEAGPAQLPAGGPAQGGPAQGGPAQLPKGGPREVAVSGPAELTGYLSSILDQTRGLRARHVPAGKDAGTAIDGSVDIAVVATASLFDPEPARLAQMCVQRCRPVLFFGVLHDGASFVGPLWTPQVHGPCFACLQIRLASHSVHAATWVAYLRHLAGTRASPVQQRIAPWAAARLAAHAAQRLVAWADGMSLAHREAAPEPAGVPEPAGSEVTWWDEPDAPALTRRLLPVPTCRACRDQEGAVEPVAGMDTAVDEQIGIVHATSTHPAAIGPRIHLSGSTSADFHVIQPAMRVTRNGGAGFTAGDATRATIGEALERYAAGVYRRDRLRLAAWRDLTEPAVRPDAFGLFHPDQYRRPGFPFVAFDEATTVRWTRAERLGGTEHALLPASQVYLHYRRVPGEAAIGPSISTGLAAGPTLAHATLAGLYEVVERDALAIGWLHRIPPRPVPADILAASPRLSAHLSTGGNWRVRFHDLSLDLAPPVIAAVMDYDDGDEHIMSFGSACRWSATDAAEKAFLEAAQGLTYVRRLLVSYRDWHLAGDPDGGEFGNVDEFNKHAILYTKYPWLRARAGYLVHPTEPPAATRPARPALPPSDVDRALNGVVEALAAAGYPCYRVDLTTPDVAQVGVRVVRVVVPGLQHLAGDHALQLLGTARLCRVGTALGLPHEPHNPYPHPLP